MTEQRLQTLLQRLSVVREHYADRWADTTLAMPFEIDMVCLLMRHRRLGCIRGLVDRVAAHPACWRGKRATLRILRRLEHGCCEALL